MPDWTPALSETVLDATRASGLAPSTVPSIGSCLRSLVTFAHKSRWLPREVDPMWHVSYSLKPEFQGQSVGFIPRASLPSEEHCQALFTAMAELGGDTWALAMRLKHRWVLDGGNSSLCAQATSTSNPTGSSGSR